MIVKNLHQVLFAVSVFLLYLLLNAHVHGWHNEAWLYTAAKLSVSILSVCGYHYYN